MNASHRQHHHNHHHGHHHHYHSKTQLNFTNKWTMRAYAYTARSVYGESLQVATTLLGTFTLWSWDRFQYGLTILKPIIMSKIHIHIYTKTKNCTLFNCRYIYICNFLSCSPLLYVYYCARSILQYCSMCSVCSSLPFLYLLFPVILFILMYVRIVHTVYNWHILNSTHWANKFRWNAKWKDVRPLTTGTVRFFWCTRYLLISQPWNKDFTKFFFISHLQFDQIYESQWLLISCGWWHNHLFSDLPQNTQFEWKTILGVYHCKPISLNYMLKLYSWEFWECVFL